MFFQGIYQVVAIEEDLDFGCEEREADAPIMAIVTLRDEHGEEIRVRHADGLLYERDINEGDLVRFIGGDTLSHA